MKAFSGFLLIGMVLANAGCGGGTDKWSAKRPAVYRTEGTVTLNGQPLPGAAVIFVAENEAKTTANGTTDASGRFVLKTFEAGDGAVAGRHKVGIVKSEAGYDANSLQIGELPPTAATIQEIVPPRYNSPQSSGLTAEVSETGTNVLKFDLQP